MKFMQRSGVTLVLSAALAAAAKHRFGPNQCVSLELSSQGTCVIRTNCNGVDTDKFEFNFNCVDTNNAVQLHSFGRGGFDAVEEFDTQVKCAACETDEQGGDDKEKDEEKDEDDKEKDEEKEKKEKDEEKEEEEEEKEEKKDEDDDKKDKKKEEKTEAKKDDSPAEKYHVTYFGPNNCVGTYRSVAGNCVIETDCDANAIKDYDFGLICADAKGGLQLNTFGKGSFKAKEVFDTLIPCAQCMQPESFEAKEDAEEAVLSKQSENLQGEVAELTNANKAQDERLEKLEGEVETLKKGMSESKLFLHSNRHAHEPMQLAHHAKHRLRARSHIVRHKAREDQDQEQDDESDDQEDDANDADEAQRQHDSSADDNVDDDDV